MNAFDEYRDSIAILRATIPYKETNPKDYEAASADCKAKWKVWQKAKVVEDAGKNN
jgi:hypothetical protein